MVGAQGRFEFTVIGNAVNFASKLEGANKSQHTRALTDIETLRLAQSQGYVADPELRVAASVPGLRQKVGIFFVAQNDMYRQISLSALLKRLGRLFRKGDRPRVGHSTSWAYL